jgi:hypothetical protein
VLVGASSSIVAELQEQRDQLKQQLRVAPTQSLRDFVEQTATNAEKTTLVASSPLNSPVKKQVCAVLCDLNVARQRQSNFRAPQLLEKINERANKRKLDELNTAYRLAGRTLVRLKDHDGVAVRIDTSFDSECTRKSATADSLRQIDSMSHITCCCSPIRRRRYVSRSTRCRISSLSPILPANC